MAANEQVDTFWLEVGQAYQKVAANHDLRGYVERDGKSADTYYDEATTDIVIMVREVDTHVKEVLPVP